MAEAMVDATKRYIGTKIIDARPLTLGPYNTYRGWQIPEGEDPSREGYLVIYPDGYESWSPKEIFDEAYRLCDAMTFGLAIEAMKKGKKVARAGWNGKDMFIVMMPALQLPPFNSQEPGKKVNDRTAKFIGEDAPLDCVPYIAMYSAQKQWVPGWLASQTDMLSEDWEIVD